MKVETSSFSYGKGIIDNEFKNSNKDSFLKDET